MQLTDRINRIQISPTAAVISRRRATQIAGRGRRRLRPGRTDFPTPDHIKQAAIKAIEENRTKYTPTGRHHAAARSHLRRGTSANWAPSIEAEGMRRQRRRQAFHLQRLSVLIQHGDEVIIPAPIG